MVALPPKDDQDGMEARVLLSECRSPAFTASYTLADAKLSMQLMDKVLWNRVNNPRKFGAKTGASLKDIVTQKNQFAGFESYPNYSAAISHRIQEMVNIANNPKHPRSSDYEAHVQMAIDIANAPTITDPSRGLLASWRTAGASSPGPAFSLHATVLGNDFYFI